VKRILLVALFGTLVACSGEGHDDLKQWMADNSKDLRGSVPKLPEVLPYQAVPYDVEGMLDPFKPGKIEPESKNRQGAAKVVPSSRILTLANCETVCSKNTPSNRSG
jgi:type IV pilus assembly protein PilP